MDLIATMQALSDGSYLQQLKDTLAQQDVLDEHRNLNLSQSSEEDFITWFFSLKIFKDGKQFSPHTLRAYKGDAKTLVVFLLEHDLSFRTIGFPEVKAYNRYVTEKYASKTAIRKLDFFRRLLDFGYETHFYTVLLSTWIDKPTARKGHAYSQEDTFEFMREERRELPQDEAERLLAFFPEIVKTDRYKEQLQARNLLIGYLLYTTGLRASELLQLNWGSFRKNRRGTLLMDVIGKGRKPRTIPLKKETADVLFRYREITAQTTVLNPRDLSPLFYTFHYKEQKRLTYPALYKLVKQVVTAAQEKTDISPHWFRHTFVTVMLENDVPLAVVKDWAGHADISTTNIYLERINQDRMDEHLDKVKMF
ncbi:phage integrase family protein [Fictibacillus macauensis ZFHKF-1]|uniref:Phage integrase family protein n=1 Tax=Fictibacillus macauensis ZFHKF-1 TaxID=1196324 RepID=I8UIP3_9BACL|nr:tyrosine-type recombinase/integrase [Fictibacillus macauensis]EIT86703.1 phage integrase family protein [Fictibacillus macauensis ZFHKF-1]